MEDFGWCSLQDFDCGSLIHYWAAASAPLQVISSMTFLDYTSSLHVKQTLSTAFSSEVVSSHEIVIPNSEELEMANESNEEVNGVYRKIGRPCVPCASYQLVSSCSPQQIRQ